MKFLFAIFCLFVLACSGSDISDQNGFEASQNGASIETGDVVTMPLNPAAGQCGRYGVSDYNYQIVQGDGPEYGIYRIGTTYNAIVINMTATASSVGFAWMVPLASILPDKTKIRSFSYTASAFSSSGDVSNQLETSAYLFEGGTTTQSVTVPVTNESTDYPVLLSFNPPIVIDDAYLYVRFNPNGTGLSHDTILELKDLEVSFVF